MPEYLSIPRPTGTAALVLALAGVAWLVTVTALLRRSRPNAGAWGLGVGAQRTRRPALGAMRPGHDAIRPVPRGRRRTTAVPRQDTEPRRPDTDRRQDRGVRRPAPARLPHSSARQALPAVPAQRRTGPPLEAVELTAAERAAFEGLVRRLGDDR
ncbi:hypothetical protein ACFYO5_29980 [Streptomyces sp. NPDC006259]|uniref:hypothetical protein n=1 Tax=Streptomyces sp. NPDC006259 TaxID=3364740 RepID=UPI0036BC9302